MSPRLISVFFLPLVTVFFAEILCAQNPSGQGGEVVVTAVPASAASGVSVLASAQGDYTLVAGDTIQTSIFREPDLTARATVGQDGKVQLPLLREVSVGGKTVREARDLIAKLYGQKYVVNPQVTVDVVRFSPRSFTIIGQVARPGNFDQPAGQPMDILQAIGIAGGFTRIADRGSVTVRRALADCQGKVYKINVKRIMDGKDKSFLILPGDVVTVKESWF